MHEIKLASASHAFTATFVVSILPVFLLTLIPLLSRAFSSNLKKLNHESLPLNFMMCFAAGSLLADALIHLSEDVKEGELLPVVSACIAGIISFFTIDRFSRISNNHNNVDQKQIGFISLVADAVHNFTDGMAIAAAFGKNMKTGYASTLAIFLHEIPHELGDYALLAKFGFNHADIIKWQLLTGAAAFAGTAFGVSLEGSEAHGSSWLLPFSCGGFLYLGLCSILSEVVTDTKRNNFKSLISDVFALTLGVAILFVMELYY